MANLVISAKNKTVTRVDLTPTQVKAHEDRARDHDIRVANERAKVNEAKLKKAKFLNTLTKDQKDGFEAILKYGIDT